MSYHKNLLELAKELATADRKRPRQARLQRAVSSTYSSVFHLLVDAGSRFLVSGREREPLRHCVARGFVHAEMKEVAKQIASKQIPRQIASAIEGLTIPQKLADVASAFVDLFMGAGSVDEVCGLAPRLSTLHPLSLQRTSSTPS